MSLHFTFRKIEASEALKTKITKKVDRFRKYVDYAMEVHVLLGVEKTQHVVEITCHAEHRDLIATSKTKNLYESIDGAVGKIETQLKKEREKRKGHTRAHQAARPKSLKMAKDVGAEIPHREKKLRIVET